MFTSKTSQSRCDDNSTFVNYEIRENQFSVSEIEEPLLL